ncbi:50S ribosomal protein L30 [Polyangium jinanense]|uniref:50S ribosomal protein L30 n=1 Tax=Polyangium jinanense TaxID=2829994 RepID=A0A9X3X4C6_9BACT|nr:50S ribosomal protein L30 [Polyangium jinanense]MDC3952243.1 50S ribosomal protein L30 [Polyangium jinanense]MDC3956388.1 50S ribosomal protein L30 [Polyangium jinanense]MDC3979872.1 50S ribosomal protein L30 [Polyangium jinanense]MDC3982525.1 50S ribosomal protein L30 [Polyangium jinanense]
MRQTGSVTNQTEHTRKVLRGLGLRKPGHEVLVENTPSFRGMVKKVIHLVSVEEVDGNGAQASK